MSLAPTRAFWIATHRYMGLATLGFLLVAAVTGCLLCVRAPLDAALNPDLFRSSGGAGRIDPVAAVAAFERAHPELRALSFPLAIPDGGNLPVSVAARSRTGPPLSYDQAFLDGADGHLAGVRSTQPGWDRRHLMQGVYTLHFTLLAGTVGRWFMGVVALGWLIGAGVGLYLTFPARPPYLRPWFKAWAVRVRSKLPRLLLDLHQASSLWVIVGVFGLAATSVCLNFFDEAVQPLATAISPARPSPFDAPAAAAPGPRQLDFAQALSAARLHAQAAGSAWKLASLAYEPKLNLYGVTFTANGRVNYAGLGPVTDWFDAADGRFIYEDSPYADSFGRQMTRALYPLHTGQVIGPVGMVFIFVVGLQTVELCLTGLYVWWVRRPPRVAFRKATRLAAKGAA
jgi:uncharacterized iron-regulated membrane protein